MAYISSKKYGSAAAVSLEVNVNIKDNIAKQTDGTSLNVATNPDGSTSHDVISSWGYWNDSAETTGDKVWIAGTKTAASVIDTQKTNHTAATYRGKAIGSVNGTDKIKVDGTNAVTLNFDLGGGGNDLVDGSINFDTTSGKEWRGVVGAGTVTGNGFDVTPSGTGDGNSITSGSIKGNFYGSDAQQVGGTFKMATGSDTASGVFKATK